MHIIQIASEIAPIAKVGGLSDVLFGLSRQLVQLGHSVEVILPKYDCLRMEQITDLVHCKSEITMCFGDCYFTLEVWQGEMEGLRITLLDPQHADLFFQRNCFYGCEDDNERFACFASAALEYLLSQQKQQQTIYDVVHVHDWQTAIIPALHAVKYKDLGLAVNRFVLTLHNLEYQGHCGIELLQQLQVVMSPAWLQALQDPYYPTAYNLLKGGIIYADAITTVSPTYALECQTSAGGRHLDLILKQYHSKFYGILNGIDYHYWNPQTDRYLPAHYHADALPLSLQNKYVLQFLLRQRLNLTLNQRKPLVGCITRIVPQKGIELIRRAIARTLEQGGQFILLGTSPIAEIQSEFDALKLELSNNSNIHFELNYNEELSHWIYAGCDLFIVPSIFEPCGLTQMIALRYGTVPLVRKTGGLADSVHDIEYSGKSFAQTNGFVFESSDCAGIDWALDRAFAFYCEQPLEWQQLIAQGMQMDFSWCQSAQAYVDIYQTSQLC